MEEFIKRLPIIGAVGSPVGGWWVSVEVADKWLSVLIKFFGCVGCVASLYWMWRLNRMDQRHKQAVLCDDCITGFPPEGNCPIPPKHRPVGCPKNKKTL